MRLGFWPPVYGNWIMTDSPDQGVASYEYVKETTLLAEQLGFDTLLLAEHFIHPTGRDAGYGRCLDQRSRTGRTDIQNRNHSGGKTRSAGPRRYCENGEQYRPYQPGPLRDKPGVRLVATRIRDAWRAGAGT